MLHKGRRGLERGGLPSGDRRLVCWRLCRGGSRLQELSRERRRPGSQELARRERSIETWALYRGGYYSRFNRPPGGEWGLHCWMWLGSLRKVLLSPHSLQLKGLPWSRRGLVRDKVGPLSLGVVRGQSGPQGLGLLGVRVVSRAWAC